MNGTLCAIKPLMKCTSRLRRSSLATMIGHLPCGLRQRRRQFGAAIERIRALAGFNLGMRANEVDPLSLGEPSDGGLLRLDPKSGFALPSGADASSIVGL